MLTLIGFFLFYGENVQKNLLHLTNPLGDFHYWPYITAIEDRNKILFNKVLYDSIKSDC